MGFEWEVGSWLTSRVWVSGGTSNRDENLQKEELFSGKEGNVLFLAYAMESEMSMENQGWSSTQLDFWVWNAGKMLCVEYKHGRHQCMAYVE